MKKNRMLVLFAAYFILIRAVVVDGEDVDIGLIVDMGSREGKIINSSVSMAISDFYSLNRDDYHQMRIVLHTRDSKGDAFHALSAGYKLWENEKVKLILSAQTSTLEAKLLADLGDETTTPVISIPSRFDPSPSLTNHPFFIQIPQHDQSAQLKSIVAFIELHKWESIILIHDRNDNGSGFFDDTNLRIARKVALPAASSNDDLIIEQLHKLRAMETSVFVVDVSHVIASRLFVHAKRLGMISEGYVWIVTSKTMDQLRNLTDSSIYESMQGFVGFRSYARESKELHDINSRFRKEVYHGKELDMQEMMNVGLWAYDVAWSLAKAANNITRKVNVANFDNIIDRKLTSSTFEIVNVMNEGERRVGFWTSAGKITKKLYASTHGRHLFSGSRTDDLETIIWPGGTSTIPKGRMLQMSSKILRIGVPMSKGFTQLLKVDIDLQTNETIVSGFCIDVFRAAMAGLKHQVQYQFVPFELNNTNIGETYNHLVYQVYLQKYDGIVGDITITANRSLYVDFTLPYTEMGVGMVTQLTPKDSRNLWIFLKPLTGGLWLTIIGVYVVTASVISLIERPTDVEQTQPSNGLMGRMFGFSFSILVFAHWEKLSSNLSRSVVLLWVFVVFILGSNYTATLTSMMTVQHIELNSKMSNIGHRVGPVTQEVVGNLNFENSSSTSIWLTSPEEFANALTEGSKNGGISALIDEIPYIKIFLERYPARYSMIGPVMPTTNGFGFAFPKGSAMARDMSREIAKLREDGRLQMLENAWFKSPITSFDSGDTSGSAVNPLTVGDFRGLFLVSGAFSALAFLLFFASLLYKNFHIIRRWGQPEFVKQYVCMTIFKNRRSANVIYPDLDNV